MTVRSSKSKHSIKVQLTIVLSHQRDCGPGCIAPSMNHLGGSVVNRLEEQYTTAPCMLPSPSAAVSDVSYNYNQILLPFSVCRPSFQMALSSIVC